MKTHILFIAILFLSINHSFAQDTDAILKKVEEVGYKFVAPLKNGEISNLRNRKPPKNTWTYAALEKYKKSLDAEEFILFGSYIRPSRKNKDVYDFNFYAIKGHEAEYEYYFVSSVMISTTNDEYKVVNSYLFTEENPLKAWWYSTVNFFRSDKFDEIPKKFINPTICPPPPSFLD